MFEDLPLDRQLRLGLEALGRGEPTEIKALAVPVALTAQHLSISAETGSGSGSGKTLAYLQPAVQRILASESDPRAGTLALAGAHP